MGILDGILDVAGSILKPITSFLTPGVSSLAGSALSAYGAYQGQASANQVNREEAQANRDFQQSMFNQQRGFAEQNMRTQEAFQTQMASTQWQRGVSDMQAAGLNPMLAFSQGGNASPSGASSGAGSAAGAQARVDSPAVAAINAALQARAVASTISLQEAQAEKTRAEAQTERSRPENVEADTKLKSKTTEKVNNEVHMLVRKYHMTDDEWDLLKKEVQIANNRQGIEAARELMWKFDLLMKEMDFPRAMAESKAWASAVGQNIRPWLSDIGRGASAAGALRGLRRPTGRRESGWSQRGGYYFKERE